METNVAALLPTPRQILYKKVPAISSIAFQCFLHFSLFIMLEDVKDIAPGDLDTGTFATLGSPHLFFLVKNVDA
jgi:hypothetical protein